MPVRPISAVDCVSPAFSCTGRRMFNPLRFGFWNRMAVIGILTGEAASGGGFSFSSNLNVPSKHGDHWAVPWHWPSQLHDPRILALIAIAAAALVVVMFVWMYFGSVYRFVLFDSVLTGECSLRKGWHKWNARGMRLFLWRIGYTLVTLGAFGILAGIGFGLFGSLGLFHAGASGGAIAAGILVALFFGFLALALVVASLVVWVLTKDFVVLIMAFEDIGAMDAWRRLLPMLRSEGGGFVFYVGMKAALALGAGILLGIIDVVLFLVLLIPAAIVIGVVIAASPGAWHWSPGLIAFAVLAGTIAVAGIIYAIALIAAPAVVFFQSYVLNFFGSRYQPLAGVMFPEPPAPPAPETPPPPPGLAPAPVV